MAAEVQQTLDMQLLERALPFLPHGRFGQKRNIPRNSGVSILFRRVERVPASTSTLTEGTAGAPVAPSVSSVAATISQYGQWIKESDITADQSLDQLLAEFTDMLGETAGISIDTVDRGVLVAGSSVSN